MDIQQQQDRHVIRFGAETAEERSRAIVAAGYLCVDATRVKVAEDGMSVTVPFANGVTPQTAIELLECAISPPVPSVIDQMPL